MTGGDRCACFYWPQTAVYKSSVIFHTQERLHAGEDVHRGFFVLTKKKVPQVLQTHNVSGLAFKVLISIHAAPPGL